MVTKVIAALVVIGLAVGVWWLWPRDDPISPSSTTLPSAQGSTTDPAETTTTTSSVTSTTVMDSESHVVETVEEAEEILRELWFGWFEGIYNQDEDRIREVVATEALLQAGVNVFGAAFTTEPFDDGIVLRRTEILRSDDDCLATWGMVDITAFRGPDAKSENVVVLRYAEKSWRMLSTWIHPNDLWEADCESVLQPLP